MTEKEKLKAYLKCKGISKNRFYTETGLSIGFLDSGRSLGADKVRIIINKFPDLNLEWLIMNRGEMIIDIRKRQVTYEMHRPGAYFEQAGVQRVLQTTTDNSGILDSVDIPRQTQSQVPLYELDIVDGLLALFEGRTVPICHLSIPELPRCDGAVKVKGDSMYPLLKAGDIVIYKQVRDFSRIIWGEMYLISFCFDDEECCTTVKYLNRIDEQPECVRLVSYNTCHVPIEIPLSSIRALAIVRASVRFNTMA